eukprot:TRINITY_DN4916_c0_g1_i1.p2 TRINITY_DN4916_c0_g1~~TRINITY_DN4916_c0_g1_i1.p2  ORF type:complete len:582 (-),score=92.93 TRINITY_DN4916_c0_g1_i1:51-1796(-)
MTAQFLRNFSGKDVRDQIMVRLFLWALCFGGDASRGEAMTTQSPQEQSDHDLISNILPAEIAKELRSHKGPVAREYESVSIFFSDVVGYTQMTSEMDPLQVHMLLNELFGMFDEAAELHGVEKIKTIGDAYMAVAGLWDTSTDHAAQIVDFAQDVLAAIQRFNEIHSSKLNVRVGINTGPVVGGVVGTKKFTFDVWGDAVNVASRMESSGVAGRINVSGAAYALLNDKYEFEPRRSVEIKGKGPMWCYLLRKSPKPTAETLAMRRAAVQNWKSALDPLAIRMRSKTLTRNWVERARKRIEDRRISEQGVIDSALPSDDPPTRIVMSLPGMPRDQRDEFLRGGDAVRPGYGAASVDQQAARPRPSDATAHQDHVHEEDDENTSDEDGMQTPRETLRAQRDALQLECSLHKKTIRKLSTSNKQLLKMLKEITLEMEKRNMMIADAQAPLMIPSSASPVSRRPKSTTQQRSSVSSSRFGSANASPLNPLSSSYGSTPVSAGQRGIASYALEQFHPPVDSEQHKYSMPAIEQQSRGGSARGAYTASVNPVVRTRPGTRQSNSHSGSAQKSRSPSRMMTPDLYGRY